MIKKIFVVALLICFLLTNGCYTMNHVVGEGAKSGTVVTERQWYILWGLVPLNDIKSKDMAGGATNYTIKTQQSPLDVIINIFTSVVTVYSRTIEVTK